jgi:hypothetical protein
MSLRMMTFVIAVMLTLGLGAAAAHEDLRVIGTLTKHQNSTIEVKARTGKTTAIRLDKQTVITQDKKKVDATELKVGRSVVVDAYGDSEADLLALEIRIVPAIAPR